MTNKQECTPLSDSESGIGELSLRHDSPSIHDRESPGGEDQATGNQDRTVSIAGSVARCPIGGREEILLNELIASSGFDGLQPGVSGADLVPVLRAFGHGLVNADPLMVQTARSEAVSRLEALKIPGAAKLVEAAIKTAKATHSVQAAPMGFEDQLRDPEPWPDHVDGAVLLDDIRALLKRHLVLPDGAGEAVALWALHTWTFDSSFISPILAICSPEKGCGKSTLLILLRSLARRALLASNVTPSVLFRTIEKWQPTLLIDEADTFLGENDPLRGVLNSGHSKRTATVLRNAGDNHEPTAFSTWAPKAIAMIGRLPDTLEDRSVVIGMRRRAPEELVERLRLDRIDEEVAPLRQRAMRWATDNVEALRGSDPAVPPKLVSDRARDNWRPLLAIAEQAEGEWPLIASEAAVQLAGREAQNAEVGEGLRILIDVKQVFDEAGEDRLASEVIVSALLQLEESPWPDYARGQGIKPAQVARLLKAFRIRPQKIRFGRDTKQGYCREWFEDAWRRYLPAASEQAEQPEQPEQCSASAPEHTQIPSFDGLSSGLFPDDGGIIGGAAERT